MLFKPSPLDSCHWSTLTFTKPEPSQALYALLYYTEIRNRALNCIPGTTLYYTISNEWYLQGSFFIDCSWFWSLGILWKIGFFVCLYSVGKLLVVSSEWGFLIRPKNNIGPKNIFKSFFFSLLVETVDYGWLRVKGDEQLIK